jgi:cytochrome c-type biogenesis protein CcmH
MIFWILALLLLAIAVLCILLPLARNPGPAQTSGQPIDVYLEQLAQLDRRAVTPGQESESAGRERAEISRRILKQARTGSPHSQQKSTGRTEKILASLMALILVPALTASIYLYTGSPTIPDHPLHARGGDTIESRSVEEMVLMAERHLAKNPDDAKGWTVLAGVYGRLSRPTDRARALRELIRLSDPSAQILTDLGEALTVAAGDIVPAQARILFERALVLEPEHIKASFYLALAQEQEGRFEEALARWLALSQIKRDDPQWQALAAQKTAKLQAALQTPQAGQLPGPTAEDVTNAAALSGTERTDMIETMVAGLASKLEENPDDLPGWNRLMRSYVVMGKPQLALEALKKARTAFSDKPEMQDRLTQQVTALGLNEPLQQGDRP